MNEHDEAIIRAAEAFERAYTQQEDATFPSPIVTDGDMFAYAKAITAEKIAVKRILAAVRAKREASR